MDAAPHVVDKRYAVDDQDEQRLLELAQAGDPQAVDELLAAFRDRLTRMVRARISVHIQSRVDESDIVHEAFVDIARRWNELNLGRGAMCAG